MRNAAGSLLVFLVACGGGAGGPGALEIEIAAPVIAGRPVVVRIANAAGALAFESSDSSATLPGASGGTAEFRKAGSHTLTVRTADGREATLVVEVEAAPAARLEFLVETLQPIGRALRFVGDARLVARDEFGNVDRAFTGPARILAGGVDVTGLEGAAGDQVGFVDGVAHLAGRLMLVGTAASTQLSADAGIVGVSPPITLRAAGPLLLPFADFRDRNQNRVVDEGDTVTLTFDEDVSSTVLAWIENGEIGPEPFQVTITLPAGATLGATFELVGAGRAEIHPMPVDTGTWLGGDVATEDVVIDDLNGDGFPDLAFANTSVSEFYLGDASGELSVARSGTLGTTGGATSICTGDFDGNGTRDLVIGAGFLVIVLLNDGDAHFRRVGGNMLGSHLVTDVDAADFDGDGLDDIVVSTRTKNVMFLNDGDETFRRAQEFESYYTEDIAVVDIDEDGDLDCICANVVFANGAVPDAPNRIWLNDGNGKMIRKGSFGPEDRTWSIASGDIDGDGDIDIVTGERGGNHVWLNDGAGNLTLLQKLDYAKFTHGLALGDLDKDGDLDLVSTNRVWLNDGTGRMTMLNALHPTPRNRSDIALADLDGDGDLDIASALSGTQGTTGNRPNVVHYGSVVD